MRPTPPLPHSWELSTWPPDVWPHQTKRAEWILTAYRSQLLAAKAITRVGKTLVFLGPQYTRWLENQSHRVVEFQGNNPKISKRSSSAAATP